MTFHTHIIGQHPEGTPCNGRGASRCSRCREPRSPLYHLDNASEAPGLDVRYAVTLEHRIAVVMCRECLVITTIEYA